MKLMKVMRLIKGLSWSKNDEKEDVECWKRKRGKAVFKSVEAEA